MKLNKYSRNAGFTLVEIMIVVAIIGLLATILIPSLKNARSNAQAKGCLINLQRIGAAADMFATEKSKKNGDPINYPDDLSPYMLNNNGQLPACPAGGTYSCGVVGSPASCSLGTSVTPPHVLPSN